MTEQQKFMMLALEQAKISASEDEVPIGAIVVKDGQVIAVAHNTRNASKNAVEHAEVVAISRACQALNDWRLTGCSLYVTLEPCPMCAGALAWSQIGRIVYGASDRKRGFSTISDNMLHPRTVVTSGVLAEECERLMIDFFAKLR